MKYRPNILIGITEAIYVDFDHPVGGIAIYVRFSTFKLLRCPDESKSATIWVKEMNRK